MQAVECDLCTGFLSVAVLVLSFTGSVFTAWLYTVSVVCGHLLSRAFLTIIFRQAAGILQYCTVFRQQSEPIEN